jgi:hypothetical protein
MKPLRISRDSRVRYRIKNTLKRKRATVVGVFSGGIFNDAGSAFNLVNSTCFSATGGEGIYLVSGAPQIEGPNTTFDSEKLGNRL